MSMRTLDGETERPREVTRMVRMGARGNRSMSRSARQRVNRNARRPVEFILRDGGLRRRIVSLLYDGGLDAATLRQWVAHRPHVRDGSGVVSVVGDADDGAVVELNWEFAAEMMNRRTYV